MTTFAHEILRSFRVLGRSRAFTMPAIAGLAIGIAATTAVFSALSAMLLRSMGFEDPPRIAALWLTDEPHGQQHVEVAYADWREWRRAGASLEDVALASSVNLDFPIFAGNQPEHVDGTTVTGNFFRVLGAAPFAGRFFNEEDDRPGAPGRIVISHRLWRTRFGSDFAVLGKSIRVGSGNATVIGIARPEFDFPRDVAVWTTIGSSFPTVEQNATLGIFRCVARLKRGVSPTQAQANLNVAARQAQTLLPPGSPRYGVSVTPILDEIYGAVRPAIWILFGAVALVLLIACANAANLLLVRATERGREIAIRAALGAGRGRLVRLLLSESLALAAAAGILGLAGAAIGVRLLVRLAPSEIPRMDQASLDLPVLAFGILLTVATVLLFGLAPALAASQRDPQEALQRAGVRSAGSRVHTALRRWSIAGEVAVSALLLVGAGLLVHSFAKLAGVDPGFRPERVLTFRVTTELPQQQARRLLYSQILDRVRALPGVESAGAILIRPLSGTVGWDTTYAAEDQSPEQRKGNPNGNYEAISPDYFRTMGIRLLAGRDFTDADRDTAPGVAIVDEATARRLWPDGNPVGRRLRVGGEKAPWLTVVGVAAQVRYREWESARPDLYVPYRQRAQHRSDFVVKTHGDPWLLAETVRRAVFDIDKELPISNVSTMEALVDGALARSRFNGMALAALAGCALLLAAIGIYGVLSYRVVQRMPEIAVRMAVGATPAQVARQITAEGARLVIGGALAGLAGALMLRNLAASLLFGVTGFDPLTYAVSGALLLAIAIAACAGPSLRASKADPAAALRE